MTVRVEPDPAFAAGHARIVVAGGATGAAPGGVTGGVTGLRIQREEDWGDDKLGPGGWQTTEAVLQPDRSEASGADLVLHVGWDVCRHLEAGMYSLWVPGAGVEGAPVHWPDIVPMHAGAVAVVTAAEPDPVSPSPVRAPSPQPATPPASPLPPPAEPKPVATPQPRAGAGGSTGLLALLAVLVLVAGGGGAYWWLHGRPAPVEQANTPPAPTPEPAPATPPATERPPAPAPTPPASPPAAVEAPSAPAAPAGLGGLSVPDVLTQAPNPAAIAAEGSRRLQGDRKDDGVLLLESAADRGDPAAAAALARLYDPVLHQPNGPIPRPDPRQAARYYRDASRAGADVAAAREALRRELERRSASGDLGAGLSLKDFWP